MARRPASFVRYGQLQAQGDRLAAMARDLDGEARWCFAWALLFAGAAGLVGLRARHRYEDAHQEAVAALDDLAAARPAPAIETDG